MVFGLGLGIVCRLMPVGFTVQLLKIPLSFFFYYTAIELINYRALNKQSEVVVKKKRAGNCVMLLGHYVNILL